MCNKIICHRSSTDVFKNNGTPGLFKQTTKTTNKQTKTFLTFEKLGQDTEREQTCKQMQHKEYKQTKIYKQQQQQKTNKQTKRFLTFQRLGQDRERGLVVKLLMGWRPDGRTGQA